MKHMFAFSCVVLLILISVLTGCVAAQNKNQDILEDMLDSFAETVNAHASEQATEIKGVYGKLSGSGNGIQYFGAVLVKKSAVSDTNKLTEALKQDFETVEVLEQHNKTIKSRYLEHARLEYDTEIQDSDEYITVCFFNSSHPDSDPTDIKGH